MCVKKKGRKDVRTYYVKTCMKKLIVTVNVLLITILCLDWGGIDIRLKIVIVAEKADRRGRFTGTGLK